MRGDKAPVARNTPTDGSTSDSVETGRATWHTEKRGSPLRQHDNAAPIITHMDIRARLVVIRVGSGFQQRLRIQHRVRRQQACKIEFHNILYKYLVVCQ